VKVLWCALLVLLAVPPVVESQDRVVITDRGPGESGRILADALGRPYRLIQPDSAPFVLGRDASEAQTLIVLGRDAAIEGTVNGDVIVVDGDLFIRPRARVLGRTVAIGGAVYPRIPPLNAVVTGSSESFRDETFTISRVGDAFHLDYHSLFADESAAFTLPGVYGVRIPEYDRVNGLSLPVGPALRVAGGAGEIDALVTYRSDLGKFDPGLFAQLPLTRALRVEATAERGTFTNDRWIRSNIWQSVIALGTGKDTRNHYRADRAQASLHRLWEMPSVRFEPFVGSRIERAWSTGPAVGERRGPWSITGRTDTLEGMFRPNPRVMHGTILSALAGAGAEWETPAGVRAEASLVAEHLLQSSPPNIADPLGARELDFTQLTSHGEIRFLTFGLQEYRGEVHWVTTPGGATPPQRFVYFGGSGTMPFLDLLEQGGDELLLVDQRYSIPLHMIRLGFFGSPLVHLRHRLGSAGLGDLPSLEQALSVGLEIAVVRGEFRLNPANGDTEFSLSFALSR
jgi:hypothetical protein